MGSLFVAIAVFVVVGVAVFAFSAATIAPKSVFGERLRALCPVEVLRMADNPPKKLIWPTEDEMCAQAAKELSAEQLEKMKQAYRLIREQYEKSPDKHNFRITTDADGKVIAATMSMREIRRTTTLAVRWSRKP